MGICPYMVGEGRSGFLVDHDESVGGCGYDHIWRAGVELLLTWCVGGMASKYFFWVFEGREK